MRNAVRAELRAAAECLSFLTAAPVCAAVRPAAPDPGRGAPDLARGAPDLARGAPVFPLVGAAIGGLVGGTAALLAGPCPPLAAAGVAIAVGAVATGALHLDGLADTADSLGAATRERALAIMRDPRTGAYGASALFIVLILEAAALASLAEREAVTSAVAAFALSRCTAPALGRVLPYARREDAGAPGLGRALGGVTWTRVLLGVLVAAGVALVLAPGSAVALVVTTAVCWLGAVVLYRRRFGGVTGDTLGAAIAVTEAACLVVAASA
jgi:adenosylcobinamide-GDP ribazoletransferase